MDAKRHCPRCGAENENSLLCNLCEENDLKDYWENDPFALRFKNCAECGRENDSKDEFGYLKSRFCGNCRNKFGAKQYAKNRGSTVSERKIDHRFNRRNAK